MRQIGSFADLVFRKGFLWGVVATLLIGLLAAYVAVVAGFVPANADAKPNSLEVWAAGTSLDATLQREAPKVANPVALTDDNLIDGIHLYAEHCAFCHGTAQGKASASAVAKGLYPRPPQLATDGVEDDPEGYSYWKLDHGIRWTAMPSWKGSLTDRQMWTLALFLKHMDKLPPGPTKVWQNVKN